MAQDNYNDEFENPYDPEEIQRRAQQAANGSTPPAQQQSQAPAQQTPWDRQKFQNDWMGSSGTWQDFIGAHPEYSPYVKNQGSSRDRFVLNNDEVLDLLIDEGGANRHAWTGTGYNAAGVADKPAGPSNNPSSPVLGVEQGGGYQMTPNPILTAGGVPPAQHTAERDALYAELMKRSQQGLAVDRNDPVIRAQADAYSANEQRARRDYLSDAAESRGPYANMRGEQRMTAEGVGQRTGAMEAELMGREVTARRNEIQAALTQRGSMLSQDQQEALQRELAQMDDVLKRLQLQQQNAQFGSDLDYRNRALAQSGNQFQQQLGSQNDQFAARLGFDTTDRQSYWDALRRGLITS